jgi:hypothetical protein
VKQLGYLAGVALVLAATVTNASAGGPVTVPAVPELSPTSLAGGLGLLAGGVLLLRAKFRK